MKEGVSVDVGSVVGSFRAASSGEEQKEEGRGGGGGEAGEVLENKGRMPEGAREIFMPALSSTMTSGKISKWVKSVGDAVQVRRREEQEERKSKRTRDSEKDRRWRVERERRLGCAT